MTVPCDFEGSNAVLGKPDDMTSDECEPLCVLNTIVGEYPIVISCWKVTADELAEINRTGRIWLTITGETMAPAAVDGIKPFQLAADFETPDS